MKESAGLGISTWAGACRVWGCQAAAVWRPSCNEAALDAARLIFPCLRGRVVRRALDGVDDQTEGWQGPSDFPASLPDLVPHLAVNVDGEDVGLAVVIAGNDTQELAGRVVGDRDRHIGQLVDKQRENEFLVRHAERPAGELLDVGDERPFLHAVVADQVELEAFGIVEAPDWRGMVLNQAGQRGCWGRLEDAGIEEGSFFSATQVPS